MLIVETIARIRNEHFIKGKTIKEIARDLKVSGIRSGNYGRRNGPPLRASGKCSRGQSEDDGQSSLTGYLRRTRSNRRVNS